MSQSTKCGYVALIGAPNAGKSTLMNQILGTKVSIVTHKVQTTRSRIVGVWNQNKTQIVFIDTPGIFVPKRRLERAMVSAAWIGAADTDALVHIVDASNSSDQNVQLINESLVNRAQKIFLVLNKIDRVERSKLLELSKRLSASGVFENVFMISALSGDGVQDLVATLEELMPSGPWLYPDDHLSDMQERLFAAEITREKVFLQLHQELPYSITVETEEWRVQEDGRITIKQVVYVTRKGQRGILLGKGGQQIKRIGMAARKELESLLECQINLFLFVKVRENWHDDPERYKEMGLDFIN
ncbi:MAG: GTPase Era [Rhodospirillaceae bacterium]